MLGSDLKMVEEYEKITDEDKETLNKIYNYIRNLQRPPIYEEEPSIFDNLTLNKFAYKLMVMIDEIIEKEHIAEYVGGYPGKKFGLEVDLETY